MTNSKSAHTPSFVTLYQTRSQYSEGFPAGCWILYHCHYHLAWDLTFFQDLDTLIYNQFSTIFDLLFHVTFIWNS